MNFVAQTFPSDSITIPHWAQLFLTFISAVSVIVVAAFPVYMLLISKIKDAAGATREAISEVKAKAAENSGKIDAAQLSISRVSDTVRTNGAATTAALTTIAAAVPPIGSTSSLQQSIDTISTG